MTLNLRARSSASLSHGVRFAELQAGQRHGGEPASKIRVPQSAQTMGLGVLGSGVSMRQILIPNR